MIEPTRDMAILQKWIGKQETISDTIDLRPARLMQSITGDETKFSLGDDLPPLWHWLYFLTARPQKELGRDGHPKLGGFLPPVDLPRRMWAGGRFEFSNPLRFGETVDKTSTISSVNVKQGRTGLLCFVTVKHDFLVNQELRFWEEHDIVYREDGKSGAPYTPPKAPPADTEWQIVISPDPVMLFRYSALTFNGHRIHYDRQYCREVENYPDLVFHGPLTATLLITSAISKSDRPLSHFEFRAISPLFDTKPFNIKGNTHGETSEVWAETPSGDLAMYATAKFR